MAGPPTSRKLLSSPTNVRKISSGYSSLIGSSLTSVLEAAEGSKSSKPSPDLSESAGTGFSLLLSSGKQAALLDDINFIVETIASLQSGSSQHEAALVKLATALLAPSASSLLRSNQQLAAAVIKATASVLPSQRGATWDTIRPLSPRSLQAVSILAYLVTASPLNVMRCTRAFVRLLLLASRDAVLQTVKVGAPPTCPSTAAPVAAAPLPAGPAPPSSATAAPTAAAGGRKSRLNRFRKKADAAPVSPARAPKQPAAAPPPRHSEASSVLHEAWEGFWSRTQPPARRLAAAASDQVDPVVYVPVAPGGHDAILQRLVRGATGVAAADLPLLPACLAPLALVRLLSIMDVPQRNLRKQVQSVVAARGGESAGLAADSQQVSDEQLQAAESAYVAAVNGARKVVMASQGFRLLCSVLRRALLGVLKGEGQGQGADTAQPAALATCVLCCFEQLAQEGESTQLAMSNTRVAPSACHFVAAGGKAATPHDSAAQLMSELSLVSLLLSIPYHTVHEAGRVQSCSIRAGLPLLAARVLVNIANENGTTARMVASSAPAIFRAKRAHGGADGLTMLHVSAEEGALGRQWPGLATVMALIAHASGEVSSAPRGAKAVDAFDVLITATVAATNLIERCPALQYAVVHGPDGDVEPTEGSAEVRGGNTPVINTDSQGGLSTHPLSAVQGSWLGQVAGPFAERFGDLEAFLKESDAEAEPRQSGETGHAAGTTVTPTRPSAASLQQVQTPKSPREHGVTAQDVVAAAYLALLLACCCQHSPQTTQAALSAVAEYLHTMGEHASAKSTVPALSAAASALVTTLKSFVRLQSSAGVLTEQVLTRIASVIEKLQSLVSEPEVSVSGGDRVVAVAVPPPAGPSTSETAKPQASAPSAEAAEGSVAEASMVAAPISSAASWLQPVDASSADQLAAAPTSWAASVKRAVPAVTAPGAASPADQAPVGSCSQDTELDGTSQSASQSRAATPPPQDTTASPPALSPAPHIASPARSVASAGSRNAALSVSPLPPPRPSVPSRAVPGAAAALGGRLALVRSSTTPTQGSSPAAQRKRALSPAQRHAAMPTTSMPRASFANRSPHAPPPASTPPLRRASSDPGAGGTPGSGSRGSSRAAKAARLAAVMSGRQPEDQSPRGVPRSSATRRVLSPPEAAPRAKQTQLSFARKGSSRAGALSAAVAQAASGIAVSGDSASGTWSQSSASPAAIAKAASPSIARAAMRVISQSQSQSTVASGSSSHGSTSAVLSRGSSSASLPGKAAPLLGAQLADSVFGKPKTYSRRRGGLGGGGSSGGGGGISPGSSLSTGGFAAKGEHVLDDDDNLDDLLF